MKQIQSGSAESPGTSLINLKCVLGIFIFPPFLLPSVPTAPILAQAQPQPQRWHLCALAALGQKAAIWGKASRGTLEPPGGQRVTPRSIGTAGWVNGCHQLGQRSKHPLAFNQAYLFMAFIYTAAPPSLARRLRRGCQSN